MGVQVYVQDVAITVEVLDDDNFVVVAENDVTQVVAGDTSSPGLSAYDVWLLQGHVGTVADYLEYLSAIRNCASDAEQAAAFASGIKIVIRTDLL